MWTFQNLWTLDLWNVSAVKMMFLLQFHFLSTFWSTVDNSKKGKEILFLIPFAFIYLSHNVPKLNNLTNPKISSYQVFIYWSIRALQCSPSHPTVLHWLTECSPSGAAATVAVGHISLEWSVWGELVLGGFTLLIAGVIFFMDLSNNIWISYTCFTLFKTLYLPLTAICT